ncbi:MAG: hypothetical protein AAGF11_05175 [Myxococcota bacterium]
MTSPTHPSTSLLSIGGTIALVAAIVPVACKSESGGPPSITDVAGAVEIQEEIFEFECECFARFDEDTEAECLQDTTLSFSDGEVACLREIFEQDDEAFAALRCEAEALRGLLECAQAAGCPGSFDCGDGQQIAETWVCDGFEDCTNGADEAQGCETEACSDGTMIPPWWICDDFPDCPDGSDEAGCPPPFVCGDGQTVPAAWVCDNVVSCPDGADERQNCPETCERPWNLRLIDCPTLSEEVTQQVNACLEFICLDGMVLDPSRRCDGTPDCAEGEDESLCDGGGTTSGGESSGG